MELREEIMKIILQGPQLSTLMHISAASIVAKLWNIVCCRLDGKFFQCDPGFFLVLGEQIRTKIISLPVPEIIKNVLDVIVTHMNEEMQKWLVFIGEHGAYPSVITTFISNVHWNSLGNIDYYKTAEYIIFHTKLDYHLKYEIACLCCVEPGVTGVSAVLSKKNRRQYWASRYNNASVDHIIVYWTWYITHKPRVINKILHSYNRSRDRPVNQNEYMFLYALRANNKHAMKYFWEQLKLNISDRYLLDAVKITVENGHLNMVRFLLLEMDNAEQQIIYKEHLEKILHFMFTDVEWHGVFINVMYLLLPQISKDTFCSLIKSIIAHLQCESSIEKVKLFKEVVQISSDTLKTSLFDDANFPETVFRHLSLMDIKWIEVLLSTNVLCNISESMYCKILVAVARNVSDNVNDVLSIACLKFFYQLWRNAAIPVQKTMFNNCVMDSSLLIKKLLCTGDIDGLKLLTSNVCFEEVKSIFCSAVVTKYLRSELEKNSFHSISLIEQVLCKDDLETFKLIFFDKEVMDICSVLIIRNRYDIVENIMNWYVSTGFDGAIIKECLAYKIRRKVGMGILLTPSSAFELPDMEKLLAWCFPDVDRKDIAVTSHQEEFYKLIESLALRCQWMTLVKLIEWWYFGNKEAISNLKYDLAFGDCKEVAVVIMLNFFLSQGNMVSMEKFLHWCLNVQIKDNKKEVILKYKRKLLNASVKGSTICEIVLGKSAFLLADEFVSWCCEQSVHEIRKFKDDLFLKPSIIECFQDTEQTQAKLIWWFSPSVEKVSAFKEKFEDQLKKRFIVILDGFIGKIHINEMCISCKHCLCSSCKGVLGLCDTDYE